MSDSLESKIGVLTRSQRRLIDHARQDLIDNPLYDMIRDVEIRHALNQEADRHSASMEGKKGRAYKRAMECLERARIYLKERFPEDLNEDIIRETAYLIEPAAYGTSNYPQYRNTRAMAAGWSKCYPAPERIADEMTEFLAENAKIKTPVGRAFHAQLHICRIHPFPDGNGRVSRIIQNGILESNGHLPVIIPKTDRNWYFTLLNRAQAEYKEHDGNIKDNQREFYDYHGSLLLHAYQSARKRLSYHK